MIPQKSSGSHAHASEFERRVAQIRPGAHRAEGLSTLTLNVGLHCNLECELCHQLSSPNHDECMSRGVMLGTLHLASDVQPDLIDLTGGEPILWPHLREFVTLSRGMAGRVRVRTNLDALLLPQSTDLPALLAENQVEILASLPEALEGRTIGGCVGALGRLAAAGYGDPKSGAIPLDLAYNPLPGQMPRDPNELAEEFRAALAPHGICFRSLLAIVNVPLGGLDRWLAENGDRDRYLAALKDAFDPEALATLPCRHGIEVAWDGSMWDCDYNLAAHLAITEGSRNIDEYVGSQVSQMALATRRISFGEHCFACAAGGGFSEGGPQS